MNPRRSASMGALPREKKHFTSRNESGSGTISLDVRCACQYFQCDTLLPERVNPLDSRPSSKLGNCSEIGSMPVTSSQQHYHIQHHLSSDDQLQQHLNIEASFQLDNLSTKSFNVTSAMRSVDVDRISVQSYGGQRICDPPAVVDLTFVAKYPELKETIRSRGLVVRSISTTDKASFSDTPFVAGRRSGDGGAIQDPDTVSMRSTTSVRRISRSPSKADLFVAEINIPTDTIDRRDQNRRNINLGMTKSIFFDEGHALSQQQLVSPQVHVITPTPSPDVVSKIPDFNAKIRLQPNQTFNNTKQMQEETYMEGIPTERTLLPQNRPIDISCYEDSNEDVFSHNDASQSYVDELKTPANKTNVVEINDNIVTKTTESSTPFAIDSQDLQVNQETSIDIIHAPPAVDFIDESEGSKLRPTLISDANTLKIPGHTSRIAQLKRHHQRQSSGKESKISEIDQLASNYQDKHAITNMTGAISVQDASPGAKFSYASKFKSMFSLKASDKVEYSLIQEREWSPVPSVREVSPSPSARNDPPMSSLRLQSLLVKNESTSMQVLTESNLVMKKQEEASNHMVKVTETFSLKVDEMDQYSCKPSSVPPPHKINENLQTPGISIGNISTTEILEDAVESFVPVVHSTSAAIAGFPSRPGQSQLLADSKTIPVYASDTDIRQKSETHESKKLLSEARKTLVSIPINLPSRIDSSMRGLSREASEQRLLRSKLVRNKSFREDRTQSQDRASVTIETDEQDQMKKTVSFSFGDRKVMLSEQEQRSFSTDKKNWLEMTYFSRDHEYEPIGGPSSVDHSDIVVGPTLTELPEKVVHQQRSDQNYHNNSQIDGIQQAEEIQKDLEEKYFSSKTNEQHNNQETNTNKMDKNALEESLPKSESRKRSLIESAQDGTRKMRAGLKTQAAKLKTKLRNPKKAPSGSPKSKDRRRFKAPELSKLRMPDIKRPDMSKLKDFKRPEFTKFSKPDMSKFKFPDKLSSLKLTRSISFKESDTIPGEFNAETITTSGETQTQKKKFEFNFGTYPRAFRKKKKPLEPTAIFHTTGTDTEGQSIIPSTETQPSLESSNSPQGDRGPGPVRSRWADKFSDVSFNDSGGSHYRRFGSEQESFDRESSLERRMKDDLEEREINEADLGILGVGVGACENKQFAEFDEENRAIHEISKTRAGEFKRRLMVHQDSDLVSEESKDPVGWTEKEIQKNKMLLKAEFEIEANYPKYSSEEGLTGSVNTNQETISTTSSTGRKPVMEEIDNDTLFLRKRGISQDDIDLRQYIKAAIREGLDVPENALKLLGQDSEPREGSTSGYDVPPPKPRRFNQFRNYQSELKQDYGAAPYESEDDNMSMSQTESDYFKVPSRPLRKERSRSKYSIDSQEAITTESRRQHQCFDDDEEYLRPPLFTDSRLSADSYEESMQPPRLASEGDPPRKPRRRKRQQRDSEEKDFFTNELSGRSVSNNCLQPHEDVIVFRTEHEYQVALATPETYTDGASTASRKSRSLSRFEDDRNSRGAESLAIDAIIRSEFGAYQSTTQDNELEEKFVVDMMENDGYAVVRKEPIPKPTPPARRKKFSRSPGERFATMPHIHRRSLPVPERPPPPRSYSAIQRPTPPRRKSATSLENAQNLEDYLNFEETQNVQERGERSESPRNLQSGDIIKKMKYRPLPPPPRPPREKRYLKGKSGEEYDEDFDDRDGGGERAFMTSPFSSYDPDGDSISDKGQPFKIDEFDVSTQTDPLPDDFICEEFEITEDMKVIKPRRTNLLADILQNEEKIKRENEDQMLLRGLQKFRDANRRSLSEKSRASSQADRSKSHSRPQTPSAILIEKRVSTPIPNSTNEHMWQASLTVRPLEGEESSASLYQDSEKISDAESRYEEEEQRLTSIESPMPSSVELEKAIQDILRVERKKEMEKETPPRERDCNEDDDYNQLQKHYQQQSDISLDPYPSLLNHSQNYGPEQPQPPPRRRSEATVSDLTALSSVPTTSAAVDSEASIVGHTLPTRMAVADLEVERLRVHAVQAGQIMVSQLHGVQINAEELGCKSGNLVVKNIEFPEGFIEEIVKRVRNSERVPQLHAVETQTSLQTSLSEGIESLAQEKLVRSSLPAPTENIDLESAPTRPPPPQPLTSISPEYLTQMTSQFLPRFRIPENEGGSIQQIPGSFYPVDYPQSLNTLAFYNLRTHDPYHDNEETTPPVPPVAAHKRRRHHRRRSSSSEEEYQRRRRSRSTVLQDSQGVAQAGRQLISACNLSLVNTVNRLTNYLRPQEAVDNDEATTKRRYVSALIALFILTTCSMLMFLLSGKNIHHHHWDYFNPPGNDGRSS